MQDELSIIQVVYVYVLGRLKTVDIIIIIILALKMDKSNSE